MDRCMTLPNPTSSTPPAAPTGNALGVTPPKRPPRDFAKDRAALTLVKLIHLIANALPESTARTFGRTLGHLIWKFDKRHRKQILRHMDIAFRDEVTREQKEAWCRGNFEHVGLSLVEFARMGKLTRENLSQTVDLSETKVFTELMEQTPGKGFLIVPCHHGNWELCGCAVSLQGFPINTVVRPLDNPQINQLVTEWREASGHEIIHKWQVLWKLKKLIDAGKLVTIIIDQNGGVGGTFVPVFNTLASTVASPAELHLVSRVPIVVVSMNRLADGIHHKLHVWDVIKHEKTGNHEADVREVLTRINKAYEKAIRAYPEQWLWVHRRWKTRPPGETPLPDGLPPQI